MYLEITHFKSLWSNIYQHSTRSRRSLSFIHDPLGFISPNHFVAIFNLHQTDVRLVLQRKPFAFELFTNAWFSMKN